MPRRSAEVGEWQGRLAGVAEIATILGVNKSSVTRWAARGLLPPPHDTLELGRVWRVRDIEQLRGQLPGPAGLARSEALRANWESRRRRGIS